MNPEISPTNAQQEPDEAMCRTGRISANWPKHKPLLSECLEEQKNCRYGRSFAYGCLCRHPHHLQFSSEKDQR